ncbi:MAG TPA: metal-dependent hydrolase [Acidimicrobiia bacterium]|jgi:L-ascorbate metabolism protein UlaG (beta-lactamase superfamily)
MANLRITRLGHGGVLYVSPGGSWIWVDRWSAAPNYAEAFRVAERVDVVAPTHCHFDHVGDDCADLVELAGVEGAGVIGSHEMCVWLGARGIEATGMNKGGTVEAGGVRFTMVHADHTGGATLGTGADQVTRDFGAWGWVMEFEDGTIVYQSGDTDVFGDMRMIGERFAPHLAVLPIGGHYTMGPRDAGLAIALLGVAAVIPVHYATFPILAGTPEELAGHTDAEVIALEPGETWEKGSSSS